MKFSQKKFLINTVTIFPQAFKELLDISIIGNARKKGIWDLQITDIKNFTNKSNDIDDKPYGGGPGMVMSIEPIDKCISKLKEERKYEEVIYMSPDGEKLNQPICNKLSCYKNIIILCGHYKGVDQRVRDNLITKEISIGDYVLTGGELPGAILIDSIVRLIPGVLGDETSALTDSFQDNLLSPPVYTRPKEYKNWKVPDILLSGDLKEIEKWRMKKSLDSTNKKRPDLL